MANSNMGQIRDMEEWKKFLQKEEIEKLIPFEVGEKIEIKNCFFRVRAIHPHPNNMITLEMLPKAEGAK